MQCGIEHGAVSDGKAQTKSLSMKGNAGDAIKTQVRSGGAI